MAEDTEETLELFSAFRESSSSASRAPKPLSQTAENITIVTAKEIEALNAHTLADVIATVPGIQVQFLGGPGSLAFTSIQGSQNFHILVMVDGIPLNTLGENFSEVSLVPARIIERIEIVKGAASSVWGQAMGGVINVITKTPESRAVSGSLTASIGNRTTTDDNIELSGTKSGLGYYLYGGYLGSNGIVPSMTTHAQDAYAKLTYDLPTGGQIWGTFSFNHANRRNLFISEFNEKVDQKATNIYASLGMRKQLTTHLELEISGRHSYRGTDAFDTSTIDNTPLSPPSITREKVYGTSAKLVWRANNHLLVVGGEYERADLAATASLQDFDTLSRTADRWGVFLNDTYTLGNLTLIPGMRFDHSNINTDQFSPSFGATYHLDEKTLIRGYTARGYSLFSLTLVSRPPEKVWTSQIGIESSLVPYLWQKLTLFRNETWDIGENRDRNIAMGVEYEFRTVPVYNTSIGAGYTFTDTKLDSTNTQVFGIPRHTLQLALRYDDQTFRGILTGRHIFWNTETGDEPLFNGRYQGLIWDLHLGATLFKAEDSSLELFFSGHNLFNGSQTTLNIFPTPGRWFEGGMRVRF